MLTVKESKERSVAEGQEEKPPEACSLNTKPVSNPWVEEEVSKPIQVNQNTSLTKTRGKLEKQASAWNT